MGTYNFLQKIATVLNEYSKVTQKQDNNAFVIKYNNKKARKVSKLLYENSTIYLDRKYNIFLEFCRLEEESSRRRSTNIGESCDANTEINN